VRGVLDSYLDAVPEGVEAVRVSIARRLADELDADPPAYVVVRLAGALASVVDDIENERRGVETQSGKVELRELLRPVVTS
jgi:hypothetical protein